MKQPDKSIELYDGKIIIDFWESQHRYSLRGDKKWIISVTGATGMVDKSRVLIRWAVGLTQTFLLNEQIIKSLIAYKEAEPIQELITQACNQHNEVREKAADVGTEVHEWVESWINTKAKDREGLELPSNEQVLNGVTAFLRWINENKVKFLDSEKIVYSKKYKYVGIMDAKAKINGKLAMIDFKTSKGIYNEMRYQTAAYLHADQEETGDKYDERWIIKFGKEDGEFEAVKLEDFDKDFKCFLGALELKKRDKELAYSYTKNK